MFFVFVCVFHFIISKLFILYISPVSIDCRDNETN